MIVTKINLKDGPFFSGFESAKKLGVDYTDIIDYVQRGWLPDRRSTGQHQHMFSEDDLDQCRDYRGTYWEQYPDKKPQSFLPKLSSIAQSMRSAPVPQLDAQRGKPYSQIEAAIYLRVDTRDIPGMVAMGWLPDRRSNPDAKGQWMFFEEDLKKAFQAVEEEREGNSSLIETVTPNSKDKNVTQAPGGRKRLAPIETEPTGGRWSNPSGNILSLQEMSDALGISSESIKSYCIPSVGYKLPDRRETLNGKRGDYFFYESDVEEFQRTRIAAPASAGQNKKAQVIVSEHVEVKEQHPVTQQEAPKKKIVSNDIAQKIAILEFLDENESTEISYLEKRKVVVSFVLPKGSLSDVILADIPLPEVTVYDAWMSTSERPDSSPYQIVVYKDTISVHYIHTEPDLSEEDAIIEQ